MTDHSSLEEVFKEIIEIVLTEFSDIVVDAQLRFTSSGAIEKLRVFLKDESFVDVWLSTSGKYSYNWEHRHIRGLMHRHDNAPHSRWMGIKTFPKHFHDGSEENVVESGIPDEPAEAIRSFMGFIRRKLELRALMNPKSEE